MTERACRLFCVYSEFARQDTRLNDLFQPATALAARDGDWSLVRAIEKLRSDLRRGPRLLCEQAPAAFKEARRFVPEEILEPLEAKIDDRFVKQTALTFLEAADQVIFYAGAPPEDPHANTLLEFPDPLVNEEEIDKLAARVAKIQKQQDEIDETERKRYEEAEGKRQAEAELQQREALPIEAPAADEPKSGRGRNPTRFNQAIYTSVDQMMPDEEIETAAMLRYQEQTGKTLTGPARAKKLSAVRRTIERAKKTRGIARNSK